MIHAIKQIKKKKKRISFLVFSPIQRTYKFPTTISPLPQRRKFPTRKLLLERKLILLADEKKPNSRVFRPNTIEIRGVDLATARVCVTLLRATTCPASSACLLDPDLISIPPRESVLSPLTGGVKFSFDWPYELRKIPFAVSITRYLNGIDRSIEYWMLCLLPFFLSFDIFFFLSCCVFFGSV